MKREITSNVLTAIRRVIEGDIYVSDSFVFSSRRRHTRWNCDWSSDVCSSDLPRTIAKGARPVKAVNLSQLSSVELVARLGDENRWVRRTALRLLGDRKDRSLVPRLRKLVREEIGRASCRERV